MYFNAPFFEDGIASDILLPPLSNANGVTPMIRRIYFRVIEFDYINLAEYVDLLYPIDNN